MNTLRYAAMFSVPVMVLCLFMLWSNLLQVETSRRQVTEVLATCDQLRNAYKRQIVAQETHIAALQQIETHLRRQVALHEQIERTLQTRLAEVTR